MKMALVTLEKYQESIALNYLMSKGEEQGANLIKIKSTNFLYQKQLWES